MKLNRENIKGTIKEINWDRVAAIGLTIGLVAVSGKMIELNMEKNSVSLDHYSSYSEQVESIFDVDIKSEQQEEILNNMEDNLELVNKYNMAVDDQEKEEIINKMLETRDRLKWNALYLIKIDAANKSGRNPNEYGIRHSDVNEWEVHRDVDGKTEEYYALNRPARRLVNTAEALGNASKDDFKNVVKLYEDTVKQSAAYVGKNAKKEGKAK